MTTGRVRRPTALSGYLAVAAAAAGAGGALTVSTVAGLVATAGVAGVAVGVLLGRTGAVVAGSLAVFAGVVLAGGAGAGVAVAVGGTLAAVLAWDLGTASVDLGRAVGRDAPTARGELGHALASLAVGATAGAVAWALYVVAAGGLPAAALAVLVTAALLLTVALRP